ncbi:hypothetical protein ES703_34612 [subsurface metagenome]
MGKVRLKVPPWIASMLNTQGSDWSILEMDIGEVTTIETLLAEIAINNARFRKAVFDPDSRQVNRLMNIILNDRLLQFSEVTETELNDGDTLLLLPIYAGG